MNSNSPNEKQFWFSSRLGYVCQDLGYASQDASRMLRARRSNLNRSPTPRSVLPVSSRLGTSSGVRHDHQTDTQRNQTAGDSDRHSPQGRRQAEVTANTTKCVGAKPRRTDNLISEIRIFLSGSMPNPHHSVGLAPSRLAPLQGLEPVGWTIGIHRNFQHSPFHKISLAADG